MNVPPSNYGYCSDSCKLCFLLFLYYASFIAAQMINVICQVRTFVQTNLWSYGDFWELLVVFFCHKSVKLKLHLMMNLGQNINLVKPSLYDGRSHIKSEQHSRFSQMSTYFEHQPFEISLLDFSAHFYFQNGYHEFHENLSYRHILFHENLLF